MVRSCYAGINLHSRVRFAQLSRPGCSDRFSFHFLITEVQGPVSLTLNLLTLSLYYSLLLSALTRRIRTQPSWKFIPHLIKLQRGASECPQEMIILKYSSFFTFSQLISSRVSALRSKTTFSAALKKTRFRFPFLSLLTAASFVWLRGQIFRECSLTLTFIPHSLARDTSARNPAISTKRIRKWTLSSRPETFLLF